MPRGYFKSILVGIEFPRDRRQPALRRAAQVAARTGGRLTLFHSTSGSPVADLAYSSDPGTSGKRAMTALRAALQALAEPLRRKGLRVTVKVAWDYPASEAIVREVLRTKPDLVIAGSHRPGFGARLFLTNTDWQLIRTCPAPLLFVKQQRAYGKARVLAAVDPWHPVARGGQLDRRILDAARALTSALDGRMDAVHVYQPLSTIAPVYGSAYLPTFDPELEQRLKRDAQRGLERITKDFALPAKQLHLETGIPASALPDVAQRLHADVLVMGAVSRRGLRRLVIGNTAERVLDRLHCDVLVIKPRGFRCHVPRRYSPLPMYVPPM